MTMTQNPTIATTDEGKVLQSIDPIVAANALELDRLRAAKKVIEDREKVLRASVLDFLVVNGVDAATNGFVAVSRSEHERKGIDSTKLEALFPQAFAACRTTTKVEQIRVKIKG
jgi:hypothetical protein